MAKGQTRRARRLNFDGKLAADLWAGNIEATVRVVPSQQLNRGGKVPPSPFGGVGVQRPVGEPCRLVNREPGRFTIEYRDGHRIEFDGQPPKMPPGRWLFAREMPERLARMYYRVMYNLCGGLHALTDAQIGLCLPGASREQYFEQWDKWNASRGFPAASNPLVWLIGICVRPWNRTRRTRERDNHEQTQAQDTGGR